MHPKQLRTLASIGTLVCLLISEISSETLKLQLLSQSVIQQRLAAGVVRYKNRQASVEHLFEQVGCSVHEQKVTRYSNVICELPGQSNATIIVGGHFDFIERGTGIVDDWSGTALLPSLYETLHDHPRNYTFRFVAFSNEEGGLLGSTAYAGAMNREEREQTKAFINLECLGVGSPKIWVHRSSPALLGHLLTIAKATQIDVGGVNIEDVGDDDTHPFLSKKIPVASIHSLTSETFHIIHSPQDTLAVIDQANYYTAYKLMAFYLAYLDSNLR